MNIFGIELELDLFDADQLELYEKECKKVADRVNEKGCYAGKSAADSIRYQCKVVDEFFDSLFGKGTADMIFKGKSNIKDHMEAFGIVTSEQEKTNAEFKQIVGKYTPNRAERRQEQKQKHGSRNYQRSFAAYDGEGHRK